MKKVFLFIFVSFIFIFSGCTNQQEKPNVTVLQRNATISTLRAQIASRPISLQREIFRTLSPLQKYEVWMDKTEQVIERGGWNREQLAYLNSLLGTFNEEMFTEGVQQNYDALMAEKQTIGSTLFSYNQLFFIIGTLVDYPADGDVSNTDAMNPPNNGGGSDPELECECYSLNPWCGWGVGCGVQCLVGSPWGCGGWWRKPCDGSCGD